jgi:hypothetical protein
MGDLEERHLGVYKISSYLSVSLFQNKYLKVRKKKQTRERTVPEL